MLKGLAEETGELVRLAVVESGERITWVYAVSGAKRSLQIDPNYSLDAYLHTTAIGKSWLATLPFEKALKLMLRQGMKPMTKHTKTSSKAIRTELELTRKRGYATSFEETELGVIAIAAPIIVTALTGERECVGAVSLAAPTNRMNERELAACSPQLLATVGAPGANLAARTTHAACSDEPAPKLVQRHIGDFHAASRELSAERRHSGDPAAIQRRPLDRRALVPQPHPGCRRRPRASRR